MATQFFFLTTARDVFTAPDGRDPNFTYDTVVFGNGGGDALTGGSGNDWFWGSPGDLTLSVADTFLGGAGADVMVSWAPNSYFQGDAGDDIIIYSGRAATSSAFSTIYGGLGNDQIWALGGGKLYGDIGDDVIVGGMYIDGGPGNDLIVTTTDGTIAYGGYAGNDAMWAGGAANVELNASWGADLLVGDGRNTRMIAGYDSQQDTMLGGPGPDHFIQNGVGQYAAGYLNAGTELFPNASTSDIIWNFEVGTDRLTLHTAAWLSPLSNVTGSFSAQSGYNADLGLSGTLIRYDLYGANEYYYHSNVVFLAGVSTTLAALGPLLTYDDAYYF